MVFKGGWEASGMWVWVKKERSEEPKIQKQGSRTSALLTWIASVCSPDKKNVCLKEKFILKTNKIASFEASLV